MVAIADLAEDPSQVHARAAARKQQVIVEPVLLRRGALQRGTLDREDHGRIRGRQEDMPAEPIRIVFPAKRETLQ